MCEPARSAMNRCASAGKTWSWSPIRYQDGIVFQAGAVDFSAPAASEMGRWAAAIRATVRAGTSAAKTSRNLAGSM